MMQAMPRASEEEEEKKKQEGTSFCRDLWALLLGEKEAGQIHEFLDKDPRFAARGERDREDIRQFVTVMDKKAPAGDRLKAAMHISQRDSGTDSQAERFLDTMFKGFSQDGNLDNDREQVKKIEAALNGLEVNGVKLQLDIDGRADGRLAALLRTPEVVAALDQAVKNGAVQDVAFRDGFDTTNPDAVRAHNRTSQPGQERS